MMKPMAAKVALSLALVAALALAGLSIRATLALFTDTASVPANTFTTAASFGCTAGDTGLLNPTAQAADTGGDWNGFEFNPTNAYADGGGNASNYDGAGDRHRYYNYGVSVGANCAIKGIEVRLDWWLDSTIFSTSSMSVELSWDGGTSWTAAKTDTQETTTEHTVVLGGSTDTWGHAWTVAQLSDANFRVRVTSNSDSGFRDFFLDWVPVKVYYEPQAPCVAGDTGLLNPTAQVADTGGDWNGFEFNPTNAYADGGGNASNYNGAGDRHRYYNYGVSVGANCAIKGIEVRLDWWLDSTFGTSSMSVELSWDGGTSWTAAKTDTQETTSEHTVVLGGSTDTWGHAWTVAELGDANFRVRVTSNSDSSFRDFFLDWVPVKVYYGPPSTCTTYVSTDVPKAIPDLGTVSSTLTVSDSFTITDVNVGPISITHTYDSDLDVFLISPSSTSVELFTDVGGSGNNFTDTILDDEAANPITSGSAPFTGTYRPEGLLSALDGEGSSGTWELRITDDQGLDTGTLNSWELQLCQ